ncbi:unnamed protein product [Dracunculus medinensis]|uniref:Signal recognition particle 19 kDa protein n=1 Tax=Dracunculus medinensis TaxID=318479 RepID=A0A0N4U5Z8_DRAME|nr:unnamed protein product [Dracunculus medinensis]
MSNNFYKSKPASDESKWICLYPLYINSRKTIAQGRRVSKAKAVDSPTSQEIYDILANAGLNVKIEKQKMHPLDPNRDLNSQGRVRVQFRNDDGSLFNEKFPTRLSLMLYVCEFIPKLKSRQAGNAGTAQTLNSASGTQKSNKKKRR